MTRIHWTLCPECKRDVPHDMSGQAFPLCSYCVPPHREPDPLGDLCRKLDEAGVRLKLDSAKLDAIINTPARAEPSAEVAAKQALEQIAPMLARGSRVVAELARHFGWHADAAARAEREAILAVVRRYMRGGDLWDGEDGNEAAACIARDAFDIHARSKP